MLPQPCTQTLKFMSLDIEDLLARRLFVRLEKQAIGTLSLAFTMNSTYLINTRYDHFSKKKNRSMYFSRQQKSAASWQIKQLLQISYFKISLSKPMSLMRPIETM